MNLLRTFPNDSNARVRKLTLERLERRLPLTASSEIDLSIYADLLAGLDPDQQEVLGNFLANLRSNSQHSGGIETLTPPRQTTPTLIPSTTGEVVRLRLDARDAKPTVGDTFMVDFYVKEFAKEAGFQRQADGLSGLFQATFDLQYDPSVIEPLTDGIFLDERFAGAARLSNDTAGVLRDVGGYINILTGIGTTEIPANSPDEFLLSSIPFRVLSTGNATITPIASDNGESFLVYGLDAPLPNANVTMSPLNLTVAADGEEPSPIVSPPPGISQAPNVVIAPIDNRAAPTGGSVDNGATLSDSRSQSNHDDDDDNKKVSFEAIDVLPTRSNRQSKSELTAAKTDEPDQSDDEGPSVRFWREFDLDLLDDEAAVSLFELHFRAFRLRLANDWRPADRPSDETGREPESVIDAGMADIALWLSDPRYRSWSDRAPTHGSQPTHVDEAIADVVLSDAAWQPRGKTADLQRLEFSEEVADNPDLALADLLRRFGDFDAKTKVPESESQSTD